MRTDQENPSTVTSPEGMLLLMSSGFLRRLGLLSFVVEPCTEGDFQIGVSTFGHSRLWPAKNTSEQEPSP